MASFQQLFDWHAPSYDLMAKYGISHSSVLESVWYVVDAINSLEDFFIEYPSDQHIPQKVADDFRSASGVGFENCVGAIEGILIWIHEASKAMSCRCSKADLMLSWSTRGWISRR